MKRLGKHSWGRTKLCNGNMKIQYFKETDSMYISFNNNPSTETVVINDSVNLDFDENKQITGIDIHSGASSFNINELELDLPKIKQKLG